MRTRRTTGCIHNDMNTRSEKMYWWCDFRILQVYIWARLVGIWATCSCRGGDADHVRAAWISPRQPHNKGQQVRVHRRHSQLAEHFCNLQYIHTCNVVHGEHSLRDNEGSTVVATKPYRSRSWHWMEHRASPPRWGKLPTPEPAAGRHGDLRRQQWPSHKEYSQNILII